MRRGVRRLAGQCLLVKCPDTSRRSCRRKRKGKRGTCRIWPECRCIRAAGGIRICLVRQILPSLPVPFSSTASNRSLYGLFTSRHCPGRRPSHQSPGRLPNQQFSRKHNLFMLPVLPYYVKQQVDCNLRHLLYRLTDGRQGRSIVCPDLQTVKSRH